MINLQQYYPEDYLVSARQLPNLEIRWKQGDPVEPDDEQATVRVETPDGAYR
jgi:3-(3-hydroxy-phenyl)propionate hydroxylase